MPEPRKVSIMIQGLSYDNPHTRERERYTLAIIAPNDTVSTSADHTYYREDTLTIATRLNRVYRGNAVIHFLPYLSLSQLGRDIALHDIAEREAQFADDEAPAADEPDLVPERHPSLTAAERNPTLAARFNRR